MTILIKAKCNEWDINIFQKDVRSLFIIARLYLCAKNKVVIPEVPDPEDEAEFAVPEGDDDHFDNDDGDRYDDDDHIPEGDYGVVTEDYLKNIQN